MSSNSEEIATEVDIETLSYVPLPDNNKRPLHDD